MMIIEIQGDITETDCKVIAHGVNCQNKMGSGVAKALYERWPRIKEAYHLFHEMRWELRDVDKLGMAQTVFMQDKFVVNCFTQLHYGYDGGKYVDYEALKECMKRTLKLCRDHDINELAMPRIGCGLAGGDWSVVKEILEEVFPDDFQVKVYYLK